MDTRSTLHPSETNDAFSVQVIEFVLPIQCEIPTIQWDNNNACFHIHIAGKVIGLGNSAYTKQRREDREGVYFIRVVISNLKGFSGQNG